MKLNLIILWVLGFIQTVSALNYLKASSLLTCMDNSQIWASYFEVIYYELNSSVSFDILAVSNVNDVDVGVSVELITYGLEVFLKSILLCDLLYSELCPLTSGHLDITFDYNVSSTIKDMIPGIAYKIPDLDARVRMVMYNASDTSQTLACVEAVVSNGKTVQTKYAAWPIAAISGLGLITSGVVSVIGHSSTAAHIASNSMSLFVYFQSLAITSMLAVAKVPPIAAAWAQNFQWSLGVIKVGFVQDIANWYLQATGGTPTAILANSVYSVSVQKVKRSLSALTTAFGMSGPFGLEAPAPVRLAKRLSIATDSDFAQSDSLNLTLYTTNEKDPDIGSKVLILRGIQRVSYLAGIEITNLFMTAIMFLLFFTFVMVVCMTFFKAIIEICIRSKVMHEGKFNEYRQQWSSIIKGALYRLMFVALPQIAILSFWEFTAHDSAGIVVVAVFLLLAALVLMFYSTVRVFTNGRKSVREHKNPAYLLYGDTRFLNKFGFVYVQYRADCYYFIFASLAYILLKTLFVAVLQKHGRVLSLIVFIVELIYCGVVCWKRPFMDKRTNVFNIIISVINTINALFFVFFSYVFGQPQVVASVMAIVYFVMNAVLALFLLIFTIVTCVLALVYKNPDARYQPMKDDRVSFLPRLGLKGKKETSDSDDIELVALGASAMKGHEHANTVAYTDDESVYDQESHNRHAAYNSAYADAESSSKQSFVDSSEPQQPASTLTGNSSNAYQNFKTSYGGEEQNTAPYRGYYERNQTPQKHNNSYL